MKRTKKCKYCGNQFKPFNSLQKSCYNSECIRAFNKEQADKKWKKRKKEIKKSQLTITDYKKQLQPIINKIIKSLDYGHVCVSCGGKATEAGHYHSRGSSSGLDFNLHNIWMQCHKCNNHAGANIIGYDEGLIELYGREYWEYIKFDLKRIYKDFTLTKQIIQDAKKNAREVLKNLPSDKVYTNAERKQLREQLNKQINIYNYESND